MSEHIPLDDDDLPDPEDVAGRDVQPDERRLWRRVRRMSAQNNGEIQLTRAGEQVGIHPIRARELGRTWANAGLYSYPADRPGTGRLTDAGRDVDAEDLGR